VATPISSANTSTTRAVTYPTGYSRTERRLGVRPRRGTSERGLPDPAGDQDGSAPECRGASFGVDGVTGRSRGLRDSLPTDVAGREPRQV
jgi:hypothetical protein